jgi:hypothetical protein
MTGKGSVQPADADIRRGGSFLLLSFPLSTSSCDSFFSLFLSPESEGEVTAIPMIGVTYEGCIHEVGTLQENIHV